MVAQNNHSRQVSTLVGLLGEITEAYTVLVQLIEEKIEAMRRAETESIKQAVERERKLVFEIEQREGMRRQLYGEYCSELRHRRRCGQTTECSTIGCKNRWRRRGPYHCCIWKTQEGNSSGCQKQPHGADGVAKRLATSEACVRRNDRHSGEGNRVFQKRT